MGAGASALENNRSTQVFEKQLVGVNNLLNKLLTADGRYADPNYNFLFEDTCQNYTMVWEKELDSHLKVDLENVHGSIYIVPKKDIVEDESNNTRATKHELCKEIAAHYVKILYMLTLIKRVYDLENNGDNSIAGIMERNVTIVNGVMQIQYCSIPHKDYVSEGTAANVDFQNLEGLHVFVENFLTPVERHAFVEQMKSVFARKQRYRVEEIVCNDSLVPIEDYNKIYANKYPNKPFVCDNARKFKRTNAGGAVDLMFAVAENNPILHSKHCYAQKQLVIPLDTKANGIKYLIELYKDMHRHYELNITEVLRVIGRLVVLNPETGNYKLRDISSPELEDVIRDLKKVIITFYVQSIVDFQVLLDFALTLDSTLKR